MRVSLVGNGIIHNLGFISRVALAHLLGKRYPLSVTFISTYRCNFTCDYCDVWRFREKEMSTREAFKMIDEFADMGMKRLSFNGGEPLLRHDIGELIGYSKSRGVFTTMFSNGSLVEANVDKLKGLDILVISLDGPKNVHEGHRMKNTYEKVVAGIKTAKKSGINVWTNTVITKDTASHIIPLVEEAENLGVRMMFQPVLHYSHSSGSSAIRSLSSTDRAYAGLIARLKELKRNGAPIMHSEEYLDYIKVPDWSINKRKCWAARLYCAVTPNGDVAPCYPLFNSREWPSGLTLGFKRAFLDIGKFTCSGCYCALVESDFLYSFRLKAVLNLLKSMEAV